MGRIAWLGESLLVCSSFPSLQVLGREGPFPLILLPQFGGYWIEGTNHDLTGILEAEQVHSPTSVKLECNHMARIYRKHFLGKVRAPLGVFAPGPQHVVGSVIPPCCHHLSELPR